jgi:hypothetical protein
VGAKQHLFAPELNRLEMRFEAGPNIRRKQSEQPITWRCWGGGRSLHEALVDGRAIQYGHDLRNRADFAEERKTHRENSVIPGLFLRRDIGRYYP